VNVAQVRNQRREVTVGDFWHAWVRGEMRTCFGRQNLTEKGHLENIAIGGRMLLKWSFKKRP
jgi:hypothetical protein